MPGLEDELGDIVKKARAGLGLSVDDLARQTGIEARLLNSVEVYTGHPDEAQVRRLAQVLRLRPDQLWDIAQDAWSAPEPDWKIGSRYTIERYTNHYPEHCYIVLDPSGACLIVDPGAEEDRIVAAATQHQRQPAGILITHRHQDHTGAVVPVQRATGAPVYVHKDDAEGVAGVPRTAVRTFGNDGTLKIGAFSVRTLFTPGHTPGSASYVLEDGGDMACFCGDTLFAGSAGNARTSYEAILRSVRNTLGGLPRATVLYPGHGPATTVENEHARNPFF